MANTTTFAPPGLFIQTPLRYRIRELLLLHSPEEIYTTMRSIFQEDYTFYQTIFDAPFPDPEPFVPVAPAPAAPVPAAPAAPEEEFQQPPALRANTKIRIVKKPVEDPLPEQQPLHPTTDTTSEREKKTQIKKEQNEKVEKKFQELQSKGVDSYSLLTKDNLKKWVDTDKLTYTQIARDHVGLPADEIATIAKGFGIQSHIAKKRAVIIAGRKHY
jgi:hypothetical protein